MKKIGILTFQWADDFGALLQAYGLKRFLNTCEIGQAEIIPYETAGLRGRYWLLPYIPKYATNPPPPSTKYHIARHNIRNLPRFLQKRARMRAFRRTYLTDGKPIRSEEELGKQSYDMIVLGSDQIWNPIIVHRLDKAYFGAFPKGRDTVTLAYAASLGKPALPEKFSSEFRKLIRSVDVISVRERASIPYVAEQSGKQVEWMADPTLLLPRWEWEQIARTPKEANYVLLCHTEENPELIQKAAQYAKERKLPLISLRPVNAPGVEVRVRAGIGPAEFLGYIQNAACVFTNSFHATVFSLIFEKTFCCIAHRTLGSRTDDLLTHYGLAGRNGEVILPEEYTGGEDHQKAFREKAAAFFRDNGSLRRAEISEHCKGCGACMAACPQNAILMKTGQDGFAYPYIYESRCNHCGKCQRICPDNREVSAPEGQQVYGCKAKSGEIRSRSTSGGVFYLLSEQVIRRGGCVYGVVLDRKKEVRHVCAETMEEVRAMQGSKYVESRLGDCYTQIRKQLESRIVLFTGTPCQVAGLKAVVGDHPNLYTIDIVCHGVASAKVFASYMHDLEGRGEVSEFRFRNKSTGWHTSSVAYKQNGEDHVELMWQNPYTDLYFRGLISRESCSSCQYASFRRRSDITIGDYWGIETANPEFDDNKGTSLVIVHTEKGRGMFEKILDGIDFFRTEQQHCLQPQLQEPAHRNQEADRLLGDLDLLSFDALYRKYTPAAGKPGIKRRIKQRIKRLLKGLLKGFPGRK